MKTKLEEESLGESPEARSDSKYEHSKMFKEVVECRPLLNNHFNSFSVVEDNTDSD